MDTTKLKKKPGRKPIRDEATRSGILEGLRNCLTFKYACEISGVSRDTGYRWMDEDKDFATQVAIARASAIKGLVGLTAKQNGAWKLLTNLGRGEYQERVAVEIEAQGTLHVTDDSGQEETFDL